jgi:hypothetical protein
MDTYKIYITPSGSEYIERTDEDGRVWNIPTDPANSDYQRYLAWLENPQGQQSTPMVTGDVNAD